MILDETRERFIKAMAREVDPARIAEVHFFAPIRQGGVESGVAVIAARHPDDVAHTAAAEGPLDAGEESPYSDDIESSASAHSDPSEASPPQDEASGVSADAGVASDDASDASGDAGDVGEGADDEAPALTPIERHVIYTARYRLTLKGPDRGKWETNVTAEADAPIITVDAVVRGVQRRAGDVDDPTRMTGEEIRSALPAAV